MDLQTYGALNGKIENLKKNSIVVPQTAKVGQVLAVKAVDEDGKPTEWETVKAGGFGEVVAEGEVTGKNNDSAIEINAFGIAGGMYMFVATENSANVSAMSVSFTRVFVEGGRFSVSSVFVRDMYSSGSYSSLGTSCLVLVINSSTGEFCVSNRGAGQRIYKYKIIRLI